MVYNYDDVVKQIELGKKGYYNGLTTGISKLDNITMGVQKARYDVFFGNEGTGKSAAVVNSYICNPILQSIQENTNVNVLYYSLEVSASKVISKIACWILQHNEGIIVSPKLLLSHGKLNVPLRIEEALDRNKDTLNQILSRVRIMDEPMSPDNIRDDIFEFAKGRGKLDIIGNKVNYTPDDKREHVIVVCDTLSNLSSQRLPDGGSGQKGLIDYHSSNCRYIYRNKLRYTICDVMHSNRSSSDSGRAKYGTITPMKSDIMHSSVPSQNANLVMAIFNPMDYANNNNTMANFLGYKLSNMNDRYRAIFLLKNRDGGCNKIVSTKFIGESGYFSYLKPSSELTEEDYKEFNKVI